MKKSEWHNIYKKEVYLKFGCKCNKCKKHLFDIKDSVVHHKTYIHKGGIYNASASELIKLKKIELLCHNCHEEVHCNKSIDGITAILEHHQCNFCGYSYNLPSNEKHSYLCSNCEEGTLIQLSENALKIFEDEYDKLDKCEDCGEVLYPDELVKCDTCKSVEQRTMSAYVF